MNSMTEVRRLRRLHTETCFCWILGMCVHSQRRDRRVVGTESSVVLTVNNTLLCELLIVAGDVWWLGVSLDG